MKINIKKARKDIRRYRKQFNKTFRKIYGVSFQSYIRGTKIYVEALSIQGRKELVDDALKECHDRIAYTKAVIEAKNDEYHVENISHI